MSEFLMQQAKKAIRKLYVCIANILEEEEDNCKIVWVDQNGYIDQSLIRIYLRAMSIPLDSFIEAFSSEFSLFSFNYKEDVELVHESKEYWNYIQINLVPSEYINTEEIHKVINALILAIQTQYKTAEEAIDFLITTGGISSDINNP